jgi:hypothetical protein
MMIHNSTKRVNTFLGKNVLIAPGCLIGGFGERRIVRSSKPSPTPVRKTVDFGAEF